MSFKEKKLNHKNCVIIFIDFKRKCATDFIYPNDYPDGNEISMKEVELEIPYKKYHEEDIPF